MQYVISSATGIIPALAGNISPSVGGATRTRDHPRACGEHSRSYSPITLPEGSSPRLRGTCALPLFPLFCLGIIPALAGNIGTSCSVMSGWRDHPRACGEHHALDLKRFVEVGSSPRLRGTSKRPMDAAAYAGIIPALAGNILRNLNNLNISEKKEVCFYSLLFSTMSKRRNTCRNARLLSTVFACTPVFGSVAPPMPLRPRVSLAFLLVWMLDQLQSVAIHWLPIGSEYAKIKVLLVPS